MFRGRYQHAIDPKGRLSVPAKFRDVLAQYDGQLVVVPDGAMTFQEAEIMLQAIRDQEMIRRMRRQASERNQHVPVDRDW